MARLTEWAQGERQTRMVLSMITDPNDAPTGAVPTVRRSMRRAAILPGPQLGDQRRQARAA